MTPLNRGPLLGPRMPPAGMRPPLPRFGGRLPMPGMPPRMPPPMGPMFGRMRQMMPPRPGGMMGPGGPPLPPFGPRARGVLPLMPPMMGPRGMGPRGLPIRPGPRGLMPPQGLTHVRPRFPMGNGNIKGKAIGNAKKVNKLEELELKKPWMTDEIRSEIQKKNKLYAKAKKNKDAKEWDEFKDLRNKVTRMIREAKNDYLAKHPEQAHVYQDDEEPYDRRDENCSGTDDDEAPTPTRNYCEVCDREFLTEDLLHQHNATHTTCGIDECKFTAHPKIVEKHISMQHCTGLYNRMKNLSTPEDIQKWIVERKKNYPTKSHIEQKEAEKAEQKQRGEIIRASKSLPESKDADKPTWERKRKLRKRKPQHQKAKMIEQEVELYRGLRPFAGTANLPQGTIKELTVVTTGEQSDCATTADINYKISDEEEEAEAPSEVKQTRPSMATQSAPVASASCLGILASNYGSDSTDDEGPAEVPIKRVKTEIPAEDNSQQPTHDSQVKNSDVKNSPDVVSQGKDSQNSKSQGGNSQAESAKSKRERRTESSIQDNSKKVPQNDKKSIDRSYKRTRLQLLHRLLSRSIQHERNLICQCIKHIADNNFLQ